MAVAGAANRFLRHLQLGRKRPGYTVVCLSRRRDVQQQARQLRHLRQIRRRLPHKIPAVHHTQQVPRHIRRQRPRADCRLHDIRHRDLLQIVGRKRHLIAAVLFCHREYPAHGHKGHGLRLRFIEAQNHIGRPQRGMPAEIDLSARRKPAESVHISLLHRKDRLRQLILNGDLLHHLIRSQSFITHTAAGFPRNTSRVNASTTYCFISCTSLS